MGVARQVAAALGEVVGENPILRTGEPRLGKSLRNCVRRIGTEVGIDDDQFEVVPAATAPIYHSMLAATVVAPGHSKVVPLMPEFIAPQDGAEKQDCERNAVKRWFGKHHARLLPLRPVYLGDDLFACQPVAKMVIDNGGDFIFTAKESSHKALYDFIKGAEPEHHEETVRKRKSRETFRYRWIEAVPLRGGSAGRRRARRHNPARSHD
jgi:hypothetical protein